MNISEKEIVTHCVYPPIPIRDFDYCAYYRGEEDGNNGWGKTAQAAIEDFLEKQNDQNIVLHSL